MLGREVIRPLNIMTGAHDQILKTAEPSCWVQELEKHLSEAHEICRTNLKSAQLRQKKNYDLRVLENSYQIGDVVLLFNSATKVGQSSKLKSPWKGPYLVVDSKPPLYTIQNKKGKQTVHHDRIKISKGPIPFALRQMRNQLFLPNEEQDEVAIDCSSNDIPGTSMDNASLISVPFLAYTDVNIIMASTEGLLDLVFDEMNFKPDYSPDSDDEEKENVPVVNISWFLYPLTACWDCQVQLSTPCKLFQEHINVHTVNQKHFDNEQFLKWCLLILGFLHTISQFLEVPFGSLLSFVQQKKELHPSPSKEPSFTYVETCLFQEFCKTVGYQDIPTTFTVNPPNHIISLLHWKLISNILKLFSKDQQSKLSLVKSMTDISGKEFKEIPSSVSITDVVVDSHFHLDQLCKRNHVLNFQVLADYFHKSIHVLDFVIANYVFPFSWKLWQQQVNLNPKIFVTFGIHPHLVDRNWGHFWNDLIHLVSSNSCVAIGEVPGRNRSYFKMFHT